MSFIKATDGRDTNIIKNTYPKYKTKTKILCVGRLSIKFLNIQVKKLVF